MILEQEERPSLAQWRRRFGSARQLAGLLGLADITIGGTRPWDIRIIHDRFYRRVMAQGSVGLGESYMDGDWECSALDQFFDRVISRRLSDALGPTVPLALLVLLSRLQNRQTIRRAKRAADLHYDLPVDIFEATFDARLTGSCGYWANAATLDEAQDAKLDLICRKIGLKRGDVVLDIGCGWGSFMGFAAERYGADCLGITVSPVQAEYARKRYAGMPVRPMLLDYRNYAGPKHDHVVSMGMFEHVGAKNYRTFFELARRTIKEDGLFLLHTIWENERYPAIDPWQDKYIFPNGDLPSVGEITTAVEGLFVLEDVHNFGVYYDRTLMAWNAKFQANRTQMTLSHGERFCRMWEYYLLQSAAAFRSRHISVGQFVLSPRGVRGGYQSVR
ncbi:MAG TPA: cyclopropane fatty acyl phospholipid synthase [Rhizomicrobium sp.]|jgi:cyclopropane-fatty-acyl-phospholipid synthase